MPSASDGPELDVARMTEILEHHGVGRLLVDDIASTVDGVKRRTKDADCAVRRDRANLDCLAGALRGLNTRFRVVHLRHAGARR